ncbi:MAG: caspase family protein [Candidatus Aminicenantes bacterium]|nr:caspase family protein [Candidatus Aminicenantes bacterium]
MRRRLTVLGLIWISAVLGLQAETRRALLVGINQYVPQGSPPSMIKDASYLGRQEWWNLRGCLNDVKVMRELLEKKFRFPPQNIEVLLDAQATRQAIIDAIRGRLIAASSRGDVSLFYFSGHGSRFINTLNGELKRKDETIVPADSYAGAKDIRDKELARLFNEALDKGVILTAIFDSCCSGSVCRGFSALDAGQSRYQPEVRSDALEPPDSTKKPEERTELKERGILVLSAAQDDQIAEEAFDEEARDKESRPRGAFSLALSKVLSAASENEPASRIEQRLRSIMLSENRAQIPVFSGTSERMSGPLFGAGTAVSTGGLCVAAVQVEGDAVEIRGGYAVGLAEGCELNLEDARRPSEVRIRITKVEGLAQAKAAVIAGSASTIKPGSLFRVYKWTYSNAQGALKVWWPASPPKLQDLNTARSEIQALKSSGQIAWVRDPTEDSPDWQVGYDGRSWILLEKAAGRRIVLKQPWRAKDILEIVSVPGGGRAKVFVGFPAPVELTAKLNLGSGTANDAVIRTVSESEANYSLVGRLEDGAVQTAWLARNAIREPSESPLPVRSDWRTVMPSAESLRDAAAALEDAALRLQKIKGWLNLQSQDESLRPFPYHLGFKNAGTGRVTSPNEPLQVGERYNAVLIRDEAPSGSRPEQRRIYVFAISGDGRGTLLYPRFGEVENFLPPENQLVKGGNIVLKDAAGAFQIPETTDPCAYFLLTSADPLGNPWVLEFDGVKTRGAGVAEGSSNPLARLLQQVGAATRGKPAAPSHWSVEHYIVKSVPAK